MSASVAIEAKECRHIGAYHTGALGYATDDVAGASPDRDSFGRVVGRHHAPDQFMTPSEERAMALMPFLILSWEGGRRLRRCWLRRTCSGLYAEALRGQFGHFDGHHTIPARRRAGIGAAAVD